MIGRAVAWLKENPLLILIAALALGLRSYGIYFDYPIGVNHIWDEIFSVSWLLDAIEQKTLFTSVPYQYPLLLPLLYAPGIFVRTAFLAIANQAYSVQAVKELLISGGMGQLFIVVRWYSVIFGAAGVFLINSICRQVFRDKGAGLVAAVAYAVAFIPLYMAHWGKTHTIMVFFVLLSVWAAIRYEADKRFRWAYVCALAAAAAFCIHYIGIFAAIIPLGLWFWNRSVISRRQAIKAVMSGVVFCAVFYGLNFIGFIDMWQNNVAYFQSGGAAGMGHAGLLERFYYVFRDIFRLDPILLLLAVGVIFFGGRDLIKNAYGRYALMAIFGNWLLMSTLIAWPNMSRWLLAICALLLPLGAAWFYVRLIAGGVKKRLAAAVLIVLLLPGLYFSYRWLNLLNSNTRTEAADWLADNLSQDERAYSFDMYLDAPLNYSAAVWHLANNGRGASKKLKYIADNPEKFQGRGIGLYYDYGNNRFDDLAGTSTKYLVISHWQMENQLGVLPPGMSRNEAEALLDQVRLSHGLELIRSFSPLTAGQAEDNGIGDYLNNPQDWPDLSRLSRSGPFVDVYLVTPKPRS